MTLYAAHIARKDSICRPCPPVSLSAEPCHPERSRRVFPFRFLDFARNDSICRPCHSQQSYVTLSAVEGSSPFRFLDFARNDSICRLFRFLDFARNDSICRPCHSRQSRVTLSAVEGSSLSDSSTSLGMTVYAAHIALSAPMSLSAELCHPEHSRRVLPFQIPRLRSE